VERNAKNEGTSEGDRKEGEREKFLFFFFFPVLGLLGLFLYDLLQLSAARAMSSLYLHPGSAGTGWRRTREKGRREGDHKKKKERKEEERSFGPGLKAAQGSGARQNTATKTV